MSIESILAKVLEKVPIEQAVDVIKEKAPSLVPTKKPRKKADIEPSFIALAPLIRPEEVEDFIHMAVSRKTKGLPAYTYKVRNQDFLNERTHEQLLTEYEIDNFPYRDVYAVCVKVFTDTDSELVLDVWVKEYKDYWRTEVRNIDSLTAVYHQKARLNKDSSVVSIYSGKHEVSDIIKGFLELRYHWPLEAYAITPIIAQQHQIGTVSFKTAAVLDFIYNRLTEHNITSGFKEIKFDLGANPDGIENVTINGKNILNTPLACQYISLGHDIESFKVTMVYGETEFYGTFYLIGRNKNNLKIVIFDISNEELKSEVLNLIQNEYINMCNDGIFKLDATNTKLDEIKIRFAEKDALIQETIESNVLSMSNDLLALTKKLNLEEKETVTTIKGFVESLKIIAESIGSNEVRPLLDSLQKDIDTEFEVDETAS